MDGRTDGLTDGWMDVGWTKRQMNDGWRDRWIDRLMNGWINEQISRCSVTWNIEYIYINYNYIQKIHNFNFSSYE